MGSKTSSLLRPDEVQALTEKTGFTTREIVRLYNRFALVSQSISSLN